jgi:Kef-type K+ transport system membrane component KefB
VINDTGSFLIVLLVAATAPVLAGTANRLMPKVIVPIAVVELILGAIVGPHGLNAAHQDGTLELLATLGLGFLFFFAGYEIDFDRIRGTPLRLALVGWALSVAIAYTLAGLLAAAGVVISGLLTGSAMSTTAIGTILPVLRDTDQLTGTFGPSMLAAGAIGELGPVLIVTLLLTADSNTASQALLLGVFIALSIITAVASSGAVGRWWGFLERSLNTSGQEPVRLTVVLVFGLVVLASSLGLDVILGAFAAGLIVRLVMKDRTAHRFESKLEAVGFGFLIPFFFIRSGMVLDLGALGAGDGAIVKVPLFLAGFLLVRGLPALVLYRRELGLRDRIGLALLSATQLPLVVAITSLGVEQGNMRESTAVALVTAAVISVLVFPTIAIALRKAGGSPARGDPAQAEAGLAPEAESPTDAGLAPGQGGSAPTDPGLAPA